MEASALDATSPDGSAWARRLSRWTDPHPDVIGASQRRRARLVATLLLALVILGVLIEVTFFALDARRGHYLGASELGSEIGVIAALLIAYHWARTPRYKAAALLLVLAPLATIWFLWAIDPEPQHHVLLYFVAVPLLLTPFALPFRSALLVLGANLAAILSIDTWTFLAGTGTLDRVDHASLLSFVALVSIVAAIAARLLHADLRTLEKAQSQLQTANDRLAHVDRTRLQFVSTIAHDLASPLRPIRFHVQELRAGSDAPAERERSLDTIARNLQQLDRLVQDLRDLGRLESGQLALTRRNVDMAQLVRDACESFRDAALQEAIALEVAAEGPAWADVDPERMTQVLYNLLANALKFTPRGGRVAIAAEPRDGSVEVLVHDTGRGLTAEEIGRLFQPFSQIHRPAESRDRGTGLGLFICKGIAEAHGGRIDVESSGHGQGSTFRVTLPRAVAPASPVEPIVSLARR